MVHVGGNHEYIGGCSGGFHGDILIPVGEIADKSL